MISSIIQSPPKFRQLIAGSLLLLLVLFSSVLFVELDREFPDLEADLLVGEISGVFPERTGLTIKCDRPNNRVLVSVLSEGWTPQYLEFPADGHLTQLAVVGPRTVLRLTGRRDSASTYSGEVTAAGKYNSSGSWRLVEIATDPPKLKDTAVATAAIVSEYLTLRQQHRGIEDDIKKSSTELKELRQFVGDESGLRTRSRLRIRAEEEALAPVTNELQQIRREVAALESKLKLARRSSARGRLEQLATEATEREARWAEYLARQQRRSESRERDEISGEES